MAKKEAQKQPPEIARDAAEQAVGEVSRRTGRPTIPTVLRATKGRLKHQTAKARKAAARNHSVPTALTHQQYEAAWLKYYETTSVKEVAAHLGIPRNSAGRLVNRGVPELGWPSLRERMVKVATAQAQQTDYTLVKAHAQTGEIIRAFKGKLAQRVKRMDPEEIKTTSLANDLNSLARLESFVMGGEDSRTAVAVTVGKEQFDGWTVEEIVAFIETGRSPPGKGKTGEGIVAQAMRARQANEA